MAFSQPTPKSNIYRNFKAIEPMEFREIVRFYEANEKAIENLDFELYFELLSTYTDAVFSTGAYNKHLRLVDGVIETSILQNVQYIDSTDIYYNGLFKKAASLYNLCRYDEAKHTLAEVVKLNPWDDTAIQFLKKIERTTRPKHLKDARAASILLFMITSAIIAIEMLVIRIFYPDYTPFIEQSRNVLLTVGVLLLVGAELVYYLKIHWKINKWVAGLRETKFKKMLD
jgi:tetratricopeptide (TPR) repeat protein